MKKRVLLVDDNDKVRRCLSLLMHSAGFEVIEARDGLDGLTKAKSSGFDIFVVDYRMPVMDGITLIKGLKELPQYIDHPMILLSTDNSSEFEIKASRINADAVLNKPIDDEYLLQLLSELTQLEAA